LSTSHKSSGHLKIDGHIHWRGFKMRVIHKWRRRRVRSLIFGHALTSSFRCPVCVAKNGAHGTHPLLHIGNVYDHHKLICILMSNINVSLWITRGVEDTHTANIKETRSEIITNYHITIKLCSLFSYLQTFSLHRNCCSPDC
jgi:hypothetical protein